MKPLYHILVQIAQKGAKTGFPKKDEHYKDPKFDIERSESPAFFILVFLHSYLMDFWIYSCYWLVIL